MERRTTTRDWLAAALAVTAVGWGAQQFTPLLLLYRAELHLSATTVQAAFALYALGLIPGLLFGGPVSDRIGRRAVMLPTLLVSIAGTVLLLFGGTGAGWLFGGRLIAGVASGAAFSAGAAWIKELSAGERSDPGPRRVTVAMSIGFGVGPLVSGVLAQWAPAPLVLPYVPHLLLAAVALPLTARSIDSRQGTPRQRTRIRYGPVFFRVLVPLAPWVFASASIGLAYLPELVGARLGGGALIFSALAPLLVACAGIAVQPFARRIDRAGTPRLLIAALVLVTAGTLIAVPAATLRSPAIVLLAAVVLGAGYGACQVCGLLEVQRLADPRHLAAVTAAYQAVTYVGFVVPLPLAALGTVIPPGALMAAVVVLAVLTLGWTVFQFGRARESSAGSVPATPRASD